MLSATLRLDATRLLDAWERGLDAWERGLGAWEWGAGRSPFRQALFLLEAAYPDAPPEALARLPVGRRDGLLLDLRERVFGPRLESVAACPRCGEWLELAFTTADVRHPPPAPPDSDPSLAVQLDDYAVHPDDYTVHPDDYTVHPDDYTVQLDDYAVTFRLPTTEDLLALVSEASGDGAAPTPERQLLARCVQAAQRDGAPVAAADLPDRLVAAVAAQMEAADPQANVTLALTCPACEHGWEQLFDVAEFLAAEVDAWARRTIGEVHALASSYGWSEREVLSLSAQRRRLYLERVSG